jgi:hypothetical protein
MREWKVAGGDKERCYTNSLTTRILIFQNPCSYVRNNKAWCSQNTTGLPAPTCNIIIASSELTQVFLDCYFCVIALDESCIKMYALITQKCQ